MGGGAVGRGRGRAAAGLASRNRGPHWIKGSWGGHLGRGGGHRTPSAGMGLLELEDALELGVGDDGIGRQGEGMRPADPLGFGGAGPCKGVRVTASARKTGGRRVRAVPRGAAACHRLQQCPSSPG